MSSTAEHTYGTKCRLAPVRHTDKHNGLPPVDAQFFYSSVIPIDDPLSTSSIAGASDGKSSKLPLRPFARGDNNALEKAWLSLHTNEDQRHHLDVKNEHKESPASAEATAEKRALLVQTLALKHWEKHRSGFQPQDLAGPTEEAIPGAPTPSCCSALQLEVSEELEKTFCALVRTVSRDLDPESVIQDVTKAIASYRQSARRRSRQDADGNINEAQTRSRAASLSNPNQNHSAPSSPRNTRFKIDARPDGSHIKGPLDAVREGGRPRSRSQTSNTSSRPQTPAGMPIPTRPAGVDDGISGKPFVRVESLPSHSPQAPPSVPRFDSPAPVSPRDPDPDHVEVLEDPEVEAQKRIAIAKEKRQGKDSVEVAVGVSRLHMVTLPSLQMKPIYWSPINDLAVVTRATWFYR